MILEWKSSLITGLPYLENFSADCVRYKVFLFGGNDQYGKIKNELWRIDLGNIRGPLIILMVRLYDKSGEDRAC